jgi:hypothetical protein
MTYEEILQKSKEFESQDIAKMYVVIALFSEWQKETGGTPEEYLEYLEKSCTKKNSCRA